MLGVDRATPIAAQTVQVIRGAGLDISWIAAYLGGPRAAETWQAIDVQAVAPTVAGILPIYVGRNAPWDAAGAFTRDAGQHDAGEAIDLLTLWNLEPTADRPVVCLDMESQTLESYPAQAVEYIAGFMAELDSHGYQGILYGNAATIEACRAAGIQCLNWCASWITPGSSWWQLWQHTEPDLSTLTRGLSAPVDGWQFVAGVPVASEIDLSTLREDFPLMTMNYNELVKTVQELQTQVADLQRGVQSSTPSAPAPEPEPEPGTYVVKPGNTLVGIAAALGHPGEWGVLATVNPQISDPNLIHPGQVLKLPEGW